MVLDFSQFAKKSWKYILKIFGPGVNWYQLFFSGSDRTIAGLVSFILQFGGHEASQNICILLVAFWALARFLFIFSKKVLRFTIWQKKNEWEPQN